MDELEELRRRRLAELQEQEVARAQQQASEELELQRQVEQLEAVVKARLTKEALSRYGNVKTAHPDLAVQVLIILAQAIQQGQVNEVDDILLRTILEKIAPKRRDFTVTRR
ncbi:hypothetical protein JXB02_00705 [Candidatus Woesearchaeota archaeon]|nr:hypothetical protein [Candidatus Woesearchaeota archaeon]